MKDKRNIYISTPIYYASGKPHLGHAYTTILADVIKKYHELIGDSVLFITGMDEHGQKIVDVSNKANLEPKKFVDKISEDFKKLWSSLNISYDIFVRTSEQKHKKYVQNVFSKLIKEDNIYLSNWKGWYCPQCEENYSKSKIVIDEHKNHKCQFGHSLVLKNEPSYFLKISKFTKWIEQYIKTHNEFIYPKTRENEVINSFLKNEINDLSVSRINLDWGISIKEDPKHTVYVWIDALLSYLSFLTDKQFNDYWMDQNSQIIHLMSKEIIKFHCVYWPIILKMLDFKIPTNIISHGWIISDNQKMSKSLGNVVDPLEYIAKYGSDSLRFFLIRNSHIENDSVINNELFINIFNNDLANNYGNLINRSLNIIKKFSDGKVPELAKNDLKNSEVVSFLNASINKIIKLIQENKTKDIIDEILSISDYANKYIEQTKPWELAKQNNIKEIKTFVFNLANLVRVCTFFLQPILTKGTKEVIKQFNFNKQQLNFENINDYLILNDHKISNESYPIYLRIKKD